VVAKLTHFEEVACILPDEAGTDAVATRIADLALELAECEAQPHRQKSLGQIERAAFYHSTLQRRSLGRGKKPPSRREAFLAPVQGLLAESRVPVYGFNLRSYKVCGSFILYYYIDFY